MGFSVSARDKVLIITSKSDLHSDHIINICNQTGKENHILRLNTEDFLENCDIKFDGVSFEIFIKDSGRKFKDSEIKSVWYRRPLEVVVNNYSDKGIVEFIQQQSSAFLQGFYHSISDDALWVNPLTSMHKARIKLPQLKLALKLGFNVPRVLVTNSSAEVISFFEREKSLCNKTLDKPYFFYNDEYSAYFAKRIDNIQTIYDNQAAIEVCPTFFEQYIEKLYDIRVVIIKDKIFAFQIDSQSNPLSQIDFRGVQASQLKHMPHTLPDDLKAKILKFMDYSNLIFSSMDLVLSTDGNYYFIENNCNGQWLWLEYLTGVDISEALINLLFKHKC